MNNETFVKNCEARRLFKTAAIIQYGSKFVDEPTTSRIALQLAEPIFDDHELEGQISASTVNYNHIVPVQERKVRP
jgi:hypothetical protein